MPAVGPSSTGPLDPDLAPFPTPVPAVLVAVSAGGVLGGLAREAIATAWPGGTVPWAVLLANVLGSFALGAVAELTGRRSLHRHPTLAARLLRPALGTGFCGGFTTFSSLAVGLDTMTRDGRPLAAAAYLALSLVLGLAAVAVAAGLTRAVAPERARP